MMKHQAILDLSVNFSNDSNDDGENDEDDDNNVIEIIESTEDNNTIVRFLISQQTLRLFLTFGCVQRVG